MSTGEVIIPNLDQTLQLRMTRPTKETLLEAKEAANTLMSEVKRNGWAIMLGGKKPHLMAEAWYMLGAFFNTTARIIPSSVQYLEIGDACGWRVDAEAFHKPSQTVTSVGTGICLNDEDNWGSVIKYEGRGTDRRPMKDERGDLVMSRKPLQHLLGMAQTRACARALRPPLSWIVAMAGYETVSTEEMSGGPAIREPVAAKQALGDRITAKQASRIWAVGFAHGRTKEHIVAIIKHFDFERAEDVTVEKYEALIAELEKGDAKE